MERVGSIARTALALARPVVGSIALSVGGLVLTRQVIPFDVLRASNDVVGNYLQTVGSIYAVLLAFVVFVVWTQFNEARGYVEQESNELLDLYRAARGLPEPAAGQVLAAARRYAETVIGAEWSAMACGGPAGPGAAATIIDELWTAVHAAEATVEPDRSLYREVLKRLDDISDARSSRFNASRTSIPLALRILLYSGAVIMVGSMYLFAVSSFVVHAAITAALAGAISHVLYVIEDLDRCFQGHWQVSRLPFQRVLDQMNAAAAASEVPASRGSIAGAGRT
jgi:hypothetical protein